MRFLQQRRVLQATLNCSCSRPMELRPCPPSRSADLFMFRCPTCHKTKSVRTGSVLYNSKLSFSTFLELIYHMAGKHNTNVDISAATGISVRTIVDWRASLAGAVGTFILNNPEAIGGPGLTVELDEAMFGKRKYSRGSYREGIWVLGGVCRESHQCFLIPCPGNRRSADVLLPLIQRYVLPGTTVITDGWRAYNGLTAAGFAHSTVNHSLHFVDPTSGAHTNTQEGLWAHAKRAAVNRHKIDDAFFDFMFRRRFNASGGVASMPNAFNAYLFALSV